MRVSPPFNLRAWVDQHRALLKPPVGNKLLFEDGEFIVMAVGGPNARKDFHHDPGPELFYQLEGDILLQTIQAERRVDVPIREGELFLLPAEVPHSPQRGAGTVGALRKSSTDFPGTASAAVIACTSNGCTSTTSRASSPPSFSDSSLTSSTGPAACAAP
jgi:3-hydroxyanthranilate 3,4-dioxygenase